MKLCSYVSNRFSKTVNTIRRDLEAFFFKVICEGHRIFAHEPQIAFYLHDENFVELDILVFLIFDLKVGGIKIIIIIIIHKKKTIKEKLRDVSTS